MIKKTQIEWYDLFSSSKSVYDMFNYSAQRYSDEILFRTEGQSGKIKNITYGKCSEYVDNFANFLIAEGIENKKVAIIGHFCLEWFVAFFALLKLYNTVVPIRDNITKQELQNNIEFIGINGIVCSDSMKDICRDECDCIYGFDRVMERFDSNTVHVTEINCENDAMIILTSGTTEQSKAVILSHRSIVSDTLYAISIFDCDSFGKNERVLSFLPPWHMLQIMAGMMVELYYGASICLCQNLSRAFSTFEPTIFIAVPEMVETIRKKIKSTVFTDNKIVCKLKQHKTVGKKLHTIISGGAFIENGLITDFEKMGISVLNVYGMTECSPLISANTKAYNKIGSVGKVNTSHLCQIKINEDEVLVCGDIMFKGYYHDKETILEALDCGWFHTGDLGYIDDEGYLFITGRKKNLIILSDGNNVSPEYIEMILKAHDGVDDAMVFAEKIKNAHLLCADIKLNREVSNEEKVEITKRLLNDTNKNLQPYSQLSRINIVTKQFKKNSLGKIVRYQDTSGVNE